MKQNNIPLTIFRRLSLFIVLLQVLTFRSNAEDLDTLRQYTLDSIVVSSFKLPNKTWAVPVAATSMNAKTMERRQIVDMKDFSATIPNFIMVNRDTRLTSSVFIRGIGSLINTPAVAMYVDGVPHFEKSSFDINLAEIDNITFLRGPQGTLYGRNAMGGIILVNTTSPFVRQGTTIKLRYGSYNDAMIAFSHLDKINEQFAYGISGNYNHNDGFIENVYKNEKADRLNTGTLNLRLEWRPTNSLSVRFLNGFEYTRQGAFAYGVVDTVKNYVDSVSLDHDSYYDRKIYDSGLQIDYHNSVFWLRSQTSFQLLNDEYNVDQDASAKDLYYAIQGEKQRLVSEEINIKNLNESWYNWNFGLFAFNHNIDRSTDVFMNMAKPPYKLVKRYNDYSRGFAVYHQSEFQLTSKLRFVAGIRYDYEHDHSDFIENKVTGSETKLNNQYDSPLTFTQWTPKFSLQYWLNSDNQVYATVSKGYKTGGFNTVFESEDERTFGPETSWNYEIGAKTSFFEKKLFVEAALFYIDIKNQQIKQLLDLQGLKVHNAGNTVSKGAELSLRANPIRNLSLSASYGYTHATFKDYVYNSTVNYAGNFLPFIPKHTLSINLEKIFPYQSAISDQILFNVGYTGMGEIYWSENNETKQPFYGTLDAGLGTNKGKVNFTLWAKNMTDTKYLGYYFVSSGRKLGKPGKPFTAGVSLSYSL